MVIPMNGAVFDLPLSKIKIGERHRKDMGDIDTLAASIALCGLLQPIGVTGERELIFGARRLLALKQLGRKAIQARGIDIASIAEGEFHENEIRKDFTESGRVATVESLRTFKGKGQPKKSDKSRISTDEAGAASGDLLRDAQCARAFGPADSYHPHPNSGGGCGTAARPAGSRPGGLLTRARETAAASCPCRGAAALRPR